MKRLNEQIAGNTAMVYHGSKEEEVYKYLCEGKWKNYSGVYGAGLYTVYDLSGTQTEEGGYGNYIMKLYIRDLSNYWCFTWKTFQKVHPIWAKHTNEDDFIDYQAEKFSVSKFNYPSDLGDYYGTYRDYPEFLEAVDGIVYHGEHDGDCILSYNPYNCRPIAISDDFGKTWKKIDEEYIQQYKKTLSNPNVNRSFYKDIKNMFNNLKGRIKYFCKTTANKYNLDNTSFYEDKYFEYDRVKESFEEALDEYYHGNISNITIDEVACCLVESKQHDEFLHIIYENEKIPKDLRDILIFNYFLETDSFFENIDRRWINSRNNNYANIWEYNIYGIKFFEIYTQGRDYVFHDVSEEYEYIYSLFQYKCIATALRTDQIDIDTLEKFLIKLHDKHFFDSEDEYTNIIKGLSCDGLMNIYAQGISSFKDYLNFLVKTSNGKYLNSFFDNFNLSINDIQYILDNSDLSIVDIIEANSNDSPGYEKFSFTYFNNTLSFWFEKSDKYLIFYPLQRCKFELPSSLFKNDKSALYNVNHVISNFICEKGTKYLNEQRFKKLINIFSCLINNDKDYDLNHIDNWILRSNFVAHKHSFHASDIEYCIKRNYSFVNCFDDIDENLKFSENLIKKICLAIVERVSFKATKQEILEYINNTNNISFNDVLDIMDS